MSASVDGDITNMVNTGKDEEVTAPPPAGSKLSNVTKSTGDKPYEGEDICKPYNVTAA